MFCRFFFPDSPANAWFLTPEERELGYQFFEEDIRRTQELIGVDLSRWLKPAAAAA